MFAKVNLCRGIYLEAALKNEKEERQEMDGGNYELV